MKSVALFQFSLFVVYFIVTCRGLSCSGGTISVSQADSDTCYSTYAQSSAVSFFNGSVQDGNCEVFSDLNFFNVTHNWSSHYTNCATDGNLFITLLLPDSFGLPPKLSSTHCIQYNTTSCSCQMNCLLHFYQTLNSYNSYIYLEGIDCNKTLYNTTIEGIQYDKESSYWSNFTAKEDSNRCTIDPVVSSSLPLISSTSVTSFNIMPTASISSDLYISLTHFMSPTPSNKSSSRSSLLIGGTLISSNFLIPSAPLSSLRPTSFSHISSDILCSTVSNCCSLAGTSTCTSIEKCVASSTMLSHNNKSVDIMSFTYGLLTGLLLSFLITSFVVLLFCCGLKVRSKRKHTYDDVVLYNVPAPLAQATIPVQDNSAYGKAIQNPI